MSTLRELCGWLLAAALLAPTHAWAYVAEGGPVEDEDEAAAEDIYDDVETDGEPEPIDVLVEGERGERGAETSEEHRFDARDVSRMPGAFGDAFRAIEVMPGVVPLATGVPHLFARGATPSASGYFIDDIRVPYLFHLAIGPSVINPVLVDDVSFYPGAFPAHYGRHIGSIVSANVRPPSKRLRLQGEIRLFDVGAYAEVPLLDNKLTGFAAGRYAYPGPLLSVFAPEIALSYWDYQGGVSYELSPRRRLRLFAFGTSDHLGEVDEADNEKTLFDAEFHRVDARLVQGPRPGHEDNPTPRDASAKLGFTFGYDRSVLGQDARLQGYNYNLRSSVEVPFGKSFRLRGGLDLLASDLDFEDMSDPEPEPDPNTPADEDDFSFNIGRAFATRTTGTAGAYLDAVIRPMDELEIVPGLRTDVWAEQDASQAGLDPRAMLRVMPLPWIAVVSGLGVAHQQPALVISVPGLEPKGLENGLQEVLQLAHGVELDLPYAIELGVTGFFHHFKNLTDLTATCSAAVQSCSTDDRADGRAYGLEMMLQRSFSERVGGVLAYTLSRSERFVANETVTADFDRTHVLNAALGVDLGRRWHAGTRFTLYSGRPYSVIAFDDPDRTFEPTLIGKRNELRRDAFFRLDVRIEKRWVIADRGWISLVLEGLNITAQKETIDFDCRVAEVVGDQGLSCGGQEVGPIAVPSLGVSGGI